MRQIFGGCHKVSCDVVSGMKKRVDSAQRNALILERARVLFSDLGYPEVTLKLIARRCGVNRTAIYRYYKSKREIFDNVIVDIASKLGAEFRSYVVEHPELKASEKIRLVMRRVLEIMEQNIGLLDAITEYLIDQRRQGESVTRRVHRHTVGLRHTLVQLVREGMDSGEFRQMNCTLVGDILFSQIEAVALQMAVTQTANIETIKSSIDVTLACLAAK